MPENATTAPRVKTDSPPRSWRFISLRWRWLIPIMSALMMMLMIVAYGLSYVLISDSTESNTGDIMSTHTQVSAAIDRFSQQQVIEIERIAYTQGVADALQNRDAYALQSLVEPLAALTGLDFVMLTDNTGQEILSLERMPSPEGIDYAVSGDAEQGNIPAVSKVIAGQGYAGSIVNAGRRVFVVTAGVVMQDEQPVGVVVTGMDIYRVLTDIQASQDYHLAFFSGESALIGTTFGQETLPNLELETYENALASRDEVTVQSQVFHETAYQTAYFPLVVGNTPLGVMGLYQPDVRQAGQHFGRQILSLLFAAIVGVMCVAGYYLVGRTAARTRQVQKTLHQLEGGMYNARTGMKGHDEIGEIGAGVDRYADAARREIHRLQVELRQQRREVAHLQGILDEMPVGVMVLDTGGNTITLNAAARELMNIHPDFQTQQIQQHISSTIGEVLVPGLHRQGDVQEIQIHNRILSLQAAALVSVAHKPQGQIILIQDVTAENERIRQREALIDDITDSINQAMPRHAQEAALEAARTNTPQGDALRDFAREITGEIRTMQRMIGEYKELSTMHMLPKSEKSYHPLEVDELLIHLTEEWQPVALAAELNFDVALPEEEAFILADERRLQWAIGNIIDNAIKYTLPGAEVRISARIHQERGQIEIIIEDSGTGIATGELPRIFERFYRGTPCKPDGTPFNVPGTGQGLYLSQTVIQAHDGQINLASSPGKGTKVSLVFPLTADVAMAIPPTNTIKTPKAVKADSEAFNGIQRDNKTI